MTSGAVLAVVVALWLIGQWSANQRADKRIDNAAKPRE